MKHLFKFFFLGILIISGIYMSSCGESTKNYSGANLTDQESIDGSLKFVTENVGESGYITQITLYPRKNKGVTKIADRMEMYFYSEGNDSIQKWNFGLSTKDGQYSEPGKIGENAYEFTKKQNPKEKGIHYKDIDFSHIAEYVNEAGKQVEELGKTLGEPIFFSGVGIYTISLNSDPQKIKHAFTIESKDTVKSSVNRDVFYEYPFVVGADGKVTLKKKK